MDERNKELKSEEAEVESAEQEENRSLLKQLEQLGYIDAGLDI